MVKITVCCYHFFYTSQQNHNILFIYSKILKLNIIISLMIFLSIIISKVFFYNLFDANNCHYAYIQVIRRSYIVLEGEGVGG